MPSIKDILIFGASQLSLIAYNPAQKISSALQSVPPASNGPYQLLWGPAGNGGLQSYVAQGADKTITVAFRGTVDSSNATAFLLNWIDNLMVFNTVPWQYPPSPGASISQGMADAMGNVTAMTDPATGLTILEFLQKETSTTQLNITTTGHSLGGSLANLAAVWIANALKTTVVPYTFAAPTVTTPDFSTIFSPLCPVSYHCVNAIDMIPMAWATLVDALALYIPEGPALLEYLDGFPAVAVGWVAYETWGVYQPLPGTLDTVVGPAPSKSNDFPTEVLLQHSMANVYLPNCGANLKRI